MSAALARVDALEFARAVAHVRSVACVCTVARAWVVAMCMGIGFVYGQWPCMNAGSGHVYGDWLWVWALAMSGQELARLSFSCVF